MNRVSFLHNDECSGDTDNSEGTVSTIHSVFRNIGLVVWDHFIKWGVSVRGLIEKFLLYIVILGSYQLFLDILCNVY